MATALVACTFVAASCGSDDSSSVDIPAPLATDAPEPESPPTDAPEPESPTTDAMEEEPEPTDPPAPAANAGGVDPSLTRGDVDCSAEGLGSDESTTFTSAHYVVGGTLGALCFGDEAPTLIEAWNTVSTITPPLQLADLGLFGAFESTEEGDEVTLAFVNTLDDDGTLFQMSVNLATFLEDPSEAQLTMAHEFSHVFTALPSQLDRTAEAADNCATYDNGEGCYTMDSLMAQWIALFWGDGLIDQVDPNAEATSADGQERCDVDPGFFGAYAASTPEEDFAESFSAFVYRVETTTPEQQAKMEWMAAQPGLAEFRDRAVAAGVGPLQNNFDACGAAA